MCAICLSIPQVPKVLPCQHIYCLECLDMHINSSSQPAADNEDDDDDNERDGKQMKLNVL